MIVDTRRTFDGVEVLIYRETTDSWGRPAFTTYGTPLSWKEALSLKDALELLLSDVSDWSTP